MSCRSKPPLVAVCIVTYNSSPYIETCLSKVRSQSWPNIQIVIVDNASKDSTLNILSNLSDENLLVIANKNNKGFAAGQNQAIHAATDADYILVLNPDVSLESKYVEILVNAMESDNGIGSAAGCLTQADATNLMDSAGITMNWARRASERGGGQPKEAYKQACQVFGVSGAAAMYSKRMIDSITIDGQFFDEEFFAYKEDVDVAWRAGLFGWISWYEPSAEAGHVRQWHSGSSRKRISLAVRRHSYRNRYKMIIKNESFDWRWWAKLPALVGIEGALHFYLLLRDPKVLGAWKNGAQWLGDAIFKRRLLIEKLKKSQSSSVRSEI